MDPKQFIDMLNYLSGGMGEGFGVGWDNITRNPSLLQPGAMESLVGDASATAQRIGSYVPEEAGSSVNQFFEPMHDTVAAPYMRPSPQNPTQFQKFVGGMGIGDLSTRLSGEGNLGLLLTSMAIDQMARRGDPMASYLRYLSGSQTEQA